MTTPLSAAYPIEPSRMPTATRSTATERNAGEGPGELAVVDPRAPRFGQSITTTALAAGIVLGRPVLVYLVAAVLGLAVASGWRYDLYAVLWRRGVRPLLEPAEPEPAAPHRFAKLLGATGTSLASVLLVGGYPVAGYAVAAAVAVAAGLAASTGICIGCRMYRGVAVFRRLDVV